MDRQRQTDGAPPGKSVNHDRQLRVRLLAVAINQGLEPYGFIAELQAFKGMGKSPRELADEIFQAFVKNEQTKEKLAKAIVMQLMNSDSYARAKDTAVLVSRIPQKYPGLATRLKASKLLNSQVRDAFGVPEKIDRIYVEWLS
jgi:hypothetical protein